MLNKNDILALSNTIKVFFIKNETKILTGASLLMFGGAVASAIPATKKATKIVRTELGYDELTSNKNPPSKKDILKATWKCYIPTVLLSAGGTACVIGSAIRSSRKYTALETAYILGDKATKAYKEKVVDAVGEEKEKEIEKNVREEKAKEIEEKNIDLSNDILKYCSGSKKYVPVCDCISNTVFVIDEEDINVVVNELNRRMRDCMFISLNDLYYELNEKSLTKNILPSKIGDDLGWNIDKSYIDVDTSCTIKVNGTPCILLDYKVHPIYDMCN